MNRVYIIAEAGVNHNGSVKLAKKMIDAAVEAGVDCIKFQTYITEDDVSIYAKQADYQSVNSNNTKKSQFEMLKELELSYNEFRELAEYCQKQKITFISAPFELKSIDFLNTMSMPFWKIPSSEVTNYPYLKRIAETGTDIVMSTGMCCDEDIKAALEVLESCGKRNIVLLQCNTEYPTPVEDVHLKAMEHLRDKFQYPVGYSDHTLGIEIPIAAVALGAVVIEKHFTLDKTMIGPDHAASLNPEELKKMVYAIRNIEKALGNRDKKISVSERKNLETARKSIVAEGPIKAGEIFTSKNIAAKRPGGGISPMQWEDVLGKTAKRDFNRDEMIVL